MKIMHVITRLVQGGAQRNTLLCAQAQAEAGHKVVVAYGPSAGPEGSIANELDEGPVTGMVIDEMVRPVRPWTDRRCRATLARRIGEFGPDVVHTHSSKAGIIGRAAAWDQSVPAVVHTVHGLPFHSGNGWWRNRLYVAAERWAARRCHAIVGITDAMVEAFKRRGIGRAEQMVVIPSGVEAGPFKAAWERRATLRAEVREQLGIEENTPVVGMVARLDRMKG
ncbi:MAG: glycosyltransferase, partial [Phycisphaeraceae bacterium]|nr:glycosyltransferase [Phycisphaeraceae bacterium]